jgi:hypothetical protein
MDKIEQAKQLFIRLEGDRQNIIEVARRNFEIQSRLSQRQ